MKERLNHEFICKDFYKFSQDPNAKYHLCIDHKFCKGLYYDKIRISKHFNAQYLEIKYVFKDGKYQKFEDKYYSIIAKIISKSPSFHTLSYKLSQSRLQSRIDAKSVKSTINGNTSTGHLLEWTNNVRINRNSRVNAFRSVTKLMWNPSQLRIRGESSRWPDRFDKFHEFFPNLTSFICEKQKVYPNQYNLDDTDCIWKIVKQPNYYKYLEHIKFDMIPTEEFHRYDYIKHINIKNHPLTYFYKFEKLKSLKLRLPIFGNCQIYYKGYLQNIIKQNLKQCLDLTKIFIEFDCSGYSLFIPSGEPANDETECMDYHDVVDGLCKYILMQCPNITDYTLFVNGIESSKKNLII